MWMLLPERMSAGSRWDRLVLSWRRIWYKRHGVASPWVSSRTGGPRRHSVWLKVRVTGELWPSFVKLVESALSSYDPHYYEEPIEYRCCPIMSSRPPVNSSIEYSGLLITRTLHRYKHQLRDFFNRRAWFRQLTRKATMWPGYVRQHP